MANGAYTSVNNVARDIKRAYVGVSTEVPVYEERIETVDITADNIANYFDISNGSYYFSGSGSVFTTNCAGVARALATTTLTAKNEITLIEFDYSYSSEKTHDNFILIVATDIIEFKASGPTTNKSYTGTVPKGRKIEFRYEKDGGDDRYDDKCTFSNMRITQVVRTLRGSEIKPVARKIKKAYVGVNGIARACWNSTDQLVYWGTAEPLSNNSYGPAAATVGEYAIFYGGYSSASTVDAYNKLLVKSSLANASGEIEYMAGTAVGDFAVFGGGHTRGSSTNLVDAYSSSLVKSTPSKLYVQREYLAATTVGGYALFGGGIYDVANKTEAVKSTVDVYGATLVKTSASPLSKARERLAATTVGEYAIFGGGNSDNGYDSTVDAYNASLVKSTPTNLSIARDLLSAATAGGFALFAGGSGSPHDAVDAYDTSLTRTTPSTLSEKKYLIGAASIGQYAVFAGGTTGYFNLYSVDIYDSSLVRSNVIGFCNRRSSPGGTSVGDFLLFAGGSSRSDVDVYKLA